MKNEKLIRAAEKVIHRCRQVRYNEHYDVCPWSESYLDRALKQLTEKQSNKLLLATACRALVYRKKYGQQFDETFSPLLRMRDTLWPPLISARKLTKQNYKTVIKICAIGALTVGGQRIGEVQLNLFRRKR